MTTGEIELDDTLWDQDTDENIPDFDMAALAVFLITMLLTITLMNLIISLSVESLGPMIEKVELWSLEHALFNIVIFQEREKIQDRKLVKISKNFQLFFYLNYPIIYKTTLTGSLATLRSQVLRSLKLGDHAKNQQPRATNEY